ncbi:MAG: ABC transporter ATP-binding protein [Firmicutes bacterium]|nr:ABC transporter ATP-binding protein [Bacillota bacterium]
MSEDDTALLAVKGVSKRFGGIEAVRDVSFSVARGEILGLIGPNGSGKTTLLNTINGVHRVSKGEIYYNRQPIHNRAPSWLLRQGVARTFQTPRVFQSLSVLDNMLLPTIETGLRDEEAIDRILESVALKEKKFWTASQLSGGQQKLLEYARALVSRPRLILMDEPFGGVHPEIKAVMQDAIKRASREEQVTFLIVSHEIPDLLQLCHRVACLAEGQILAMGTAREVTADDRVVSAYLGRRYEQHA